MLVPYAGFFGRRTHRNAYGLQTRGFSPHLRQLRALATASVSIRQQPNSSFDDFDPARRRKHLAGFSSVELKSVPTWSELFPDIDWLPDAQRALAGIARFSCGKHVPTRSGFERPPLHAASAR